MNVQIKKIEAHVALDLIIELIELADKDLNINKTLFASYNNISKAKISEFYSRRKIRDFNKNDIKYLNQFVKTFKTSIKQNDITKDYFFDDIYMPELPSYDEMKAVRRRRMVPGFFLSEAGKRWKVYHISNWKDKGNKKMIAQRFMIFQNKKIAELYIGTNDHPDYIGEWRTDDTGKYLIIDMNTKESGQQELRLTFNIKETGSKPEIMLGILSYIRLSSDNKLIVYNVLAERCNINEPIRKKQQSYSL